MTVLDESLTDRRLRESDSPGCRRSPSRGVWSDEDWARSVAADAETIAI